MVESHHAQEDDATAPLVLDDPNGESTAKPSSLFTMGGRDLIEPLTLVFVRHGVTDMTLTHALSGSGVPGPPLNAGGRVQAAKAADAVYHLGRRTWDRLVPVTRVIASPMVRTQETGAALGRRLGVRVETEERLREIDFGKWEGLTGDEVALREGDAIHQWRYGTIAAPGGESLPHVGERLDAAMRDLALEHARLAADGDNVERSWACVSHAVAIKCAVGVSMRMHVGAWGAIWPQPASITILQLRVTRDGDIAERHILCVGAPTD